MGNLSLSDLIKCVLIEKSVFHATSVFLYAVKTSKKLFLFTRDFLIFSGGIERDQWHEMGKYVVIFLVKLKSKRHIIAVPLFKEIDSIDNLKKFLVKQN